MAYRDYPYAYVNSYLPNGYISAYDGDEADDFFEGGNYADTLYGGAGHDTLIGNAGDDVLQGGAGVDYLNGGMGNDVYTYTLADITSAAQAYVHMDGRSYVQADGIDMPEGDFSINVRFRIDEGGSGTVFSYATPTYANGIVLTVLDGAIITNINGAFHYTGTKITSLDWHDFVMAYDESAGQLKLFDGGEEILSVDIPAGTFAASGGMLIVGQEQDSYGGSFNDAEAMRGEVAELAIWGEALSEAQITNPDFASAQHVYDFSDIEDGAVVDQNGDDNLVIMDAAAQEAVDQIYDREGFDVVRFEAGISADDITADVSLHDPRDMVLLYQGQVFATVEAQFSDPDAGIDVLQFYDGSEVAIADLVTAPRAGVPQTEQGAVNEFGHNWGGVDENVYRGDEYAGKDGHSAIDTQNAVTLDIAVGTSVAEVHDMVEAVSLDQHLTLHFEAGEHIFTQQLLITRGDVTIEGAGEGVTTFVADFAEGEADNLIVVRGEDNSEIGQWKPYLSEYIGDVAQEFAYGDDTLTLGSDAENLQAGDYIMVTNTVWTEGVDKAQSTIAQVKSVDGGVITLDHKLAFDSADRPEGEALSDVKVYKTELLENVTVQDFSVRYDVDLADDYDRYELTNNTVEYAQNVDSGLGWGHGSAILIAGTHEAQLESIRVENAGSRGFALYSNLEMSADHLAVEDVLNRGDGGNGYGIEYYESYYGDFNNLEFGTLRHGITAQIDGSSAFNNFHVAYSEANVDFHGGDDRGNIYYIETMTAQPFWREGEADGLVSTGLIDYRLESNAEYNTVVFDKAQGLDMTLAGDERANPYIGHEILQASDNGAIINAGVGNDIIISGRGNDTFIGGTGADVFEFTLYHGIDQIMDFSADDMISFALDPALGITAADIFAGAYQDGYDVVLSVSQGHELRLAFAELADLALEQIEVVEAEGLSVFEGEDNASTRDYLYGDAGDNALYGYAGHDILEGGAGADLIDGGAGWDYARYTQSASGVTINLETGINSGGDAQGDVLIDIEAIVGSDHDDTLIGSSGNDYLKGGNGNDYIRGGAGYDQMYGDNGDDTYFYVSGADRITESTGTDTVYFDAAWSAESATISGNTMIFNANVDQIIFNDINRIEYFVFDGHAAMSLDELLAYQDSVKEVQTGTNGDDVLAGSSDPQSFDGLDGVDVVDYSASMDGVKVDLAAAQGLAGDANGDTYISIEGVIGSDEAGERDWIWGDGADNVIYGMDGADILEGGVGADVIDGGAGWDYARYTRSSEGVQVNLDTNVNTGGDAQGDLLYNIEAIVGSNHDDTLYGGAGNDYLSGESGDDVIGGGAGYDQLIGGNGSDRFVISAVQESRDTIRDFDISEGDILDISQVLEQYDPLTDLISDFVQITQSGADVHIGIDQDGGGDNFAHAVTLSGVSGLGDAQDLEESGALITIL